MARRQHAVWVGLALIAVVAVAWVLSERGRSSEAPLPDEADAGSTAPTREEPLSPELSGSRSAEDTDNEGETLVASPPPPAPEAPIDGSILIYGHVVDDRGARVEGGQVHLRILARPDPEAAFRTSSGAFHIRLPPEDAGRVIAYWREGERLVTALHWFKPESGDVLGPVELVVQPRSNLTVRVRDANGKIVPGAFVTARGNTPNPRGRFELDDEGAVSLRLTADPVRVWALSPDERFRATQSVQLEPGTNETIDLVLAGPWEPIDVYAGTNPKHLLTGETARLTLTIGDLWISATVIVDEGPTRVMVPPASEVAVTLDASVAKRASMNAIVSRWRNLRDQARRDGLRIALVPYGRVDLSLVDARGDPFGPLEVRIGNSIHWTNAEGHVRIPRLAFGRHDVSITGRTLGAIDVDALEQNRTVRVQGLAPVGGRYGGPRKVGPVPFSIEVQIRGGKYRGFVDLDGERWRAWVPAAPGDPVEAYVWQNLRTFSDRVKGVVGQTNLDLVARATSLEVVPRLGRVRFPRGNVRLRGVDVAYGSNAQMSAQRSSVTFAPIPPGTYELAWSTDNGKTWRVAPEHVTAGGEPRRVEVDFRGAR